MASFDEAIPPGKVGKVTAQVRTENYRGPVEKSIQVASSDSTNPSMTLRLKANIVGSVDIQPGDKVWFPKPPEMEYSTQALVRKDKTENGDLTITDLKTSSAWLIASARKVEKPEPATAILPAALAGDWIIDIRVSDDAPSGSNSSQQVSFSTGLKREPTVTIPVIVMMQRAFQVVPPSLVLELPAGATEAKATFKVNVRPGIAKDSLKAVTSPSAFSVTLDPDGERRYKATVSYKASPGSAEKVGSVVISSGTENLTVPVRVFERLSMVPAQDPVGASSGRQPPAPGAPQAQGAGHSEPPPPAPASASPPSGDERRTP